MHNSALLNIISILASDITKWYGILDHFYIFLDQYNINVIFFDTFQQILIVIFNVVCSKCF